MIPDAVATAYGGKRLDTCRKGGWWLSVLRGGIVELTTLPETNIAPENGWLEVGILVSFLDGFLAGAMLVSGSVLTVFFCFG